MHVTHQRAGNETIGRHKTDRGQRHQRLSVGQRSQVHATPGRIDLRLRSDPLLLRRPEQVLDRARDRQTTSYKDRNPHDLRRIPISTRLPVYHATPVVRMKRESRSRVHALCYKNKNSYGGKNNPTGVKKTKKEKKETPYWGKNKKKSFQIF